MEVCYYMVVVHVYDEALGNESASCSQYDSEYYYSCSIRASRGIVASFRNRRKVELMLM